MARNTIYVTGHKNPDTDTIISAMAYAYLKQQLGFDAIAVRAGKVNPETEYILNLFNEFAPPLAKDIKTCIRDIDFDEALLIDPKENLKTAMNLAEESSQRVIVVADEDRHLLGVTSLSDITKPIVRDLQQKSKLLSETPLDYIVKALNANIIVNHGNHSNGQVYVASFHNLECEGKIVVVSDNPTREQEVIEDGAKIMIICGTCSEDTRKLAEKKGCTILTTAMNIYDVTREIDYAIAVEKIMTLNPVTFNYDDYLDDVKVKINKSRFRCYPVLDTQDHVIGLISRFHVLQHAKRNLILVDHNEISQSLDGAEDANILEIIDHHRIGGIKTSSPVFFRNEQTGSCATIISEMFEEKRVELPDDLAGMLCCAIISDTVNFHSITCTEKDRKQAAKLAKIAGLDLETLGPKILEAGASICNKTVNAILHHDLKRFKIGRFNVMVGQNNIVNFEAIAGIRDKMNDYLSTFARDNNLDIVMMVFSIIDGTGSYVLYQGEEAKIIEYAFDDIAVNVDGFMFLPKVMSRKSQIIPRITNAVG